jgi:hypothetical protein
MPDTRALGMTDLEMFKAMLDRARIEFSERASTPNDGPQAERALPPGSLVLTIDGDHQPRPGGYRGFESDVAFGPDGVLLAVWAWE